MKIIITESQLKKMKLTNLVEEVLLEANKKDILVNKIGFNEEDADLLEKLTGKLSVWLGKRIYQWLLTFGKETIDYTKKSIKRGGWVSQLRGDITSIMDWYRVGLNGNIKPYENLTFKELKNKSKEWHDSLDVGSGSLNYNEENEIIRDYRKDGVGFYWVNLKTNNSEEECKRMGHCGRTGDGNTIYSLRQNIKLNDKFILNKSVLSGAIGEKDGIVYQMKGPKNSKPKEEYHPYIVDLILNDSHIKGFGSEYESSADFKITDLPENEIKKIYDVKPVLFNTTSLKRKLFKMGIIKDYEGPNTIFELELEPGSIYYYINDDWIVSGNKPKNDKNRDEYFIENLLSGYVFDFVDYYNEWESGLDYMDDDNKKFIIDYLKNKSDEEFNPEDDLMSLIKKYDNDSEIRSTIGSAYNYVANVAFNDYCIEKLRDALSEYGKVTKLDYTGANITIDAKKLLESYGYDEEEIDEKFEGCDENPECVFGQYLDDYGEKPNTNIDERKWYPDIDDEDFNSYLSDRLYEIR